MAEWAYQNYPTKPFFISETGFLIVTTVTRSPRSGASGIYEWTNTTDVMWSQLFETQVWFISSFSLFYARSGG